MRKVLISSAIVLAAACGTRTAAPDHEATAASEAVQVLKSSDSPYRVIYHPAVDLAKR
ncbi:MAG: hypothetical protein ACREMN_13695 [Gemmatimonadales bacterium]